jgi:hypothetical protein
MVSCEDQENIVSDKKVELAVKRFKAESIEKYAIKFPNLASSSSRAFLGRKTIEGQRVYSRPFFEFKKKIDYYSYKDTLSNQFLFSGSSQLIVKIKVDTTNQDIWNNGFDENVNLRIVVPDFSGNKLYVSGGEFDGKMYEPVTSVQTPNYIHTISQLRLTSGEAVTDSTTEYKFDIPQSEIEKLLQEYSYKYTLVKKDGTEELRDTISPLFSGFMLDLDDYSSDKNFTSLNTTVTLILNHKDSVTATKISSDTLSSSATYNWITYKNDSPIEEDFFIKSADREAIKLSFNKDSINNFIQKNKIYGAAIYLRNYADPNLSQKNLGVFPLRDFISLGNIYYDERFSETDSVTFDSGMLFNSLSKNSKKSSLGADINVYEFQNIVSFRKHILPFWLSNSNHLGELFIKSDSGSFPEISRFKPIIPGDNDQYVIDFYYEKGDKQ